MQRLVPKTRRVEVLVQRSLIEEKAKAEWLQDFIVVRFRHDAKSVTNERSGGRLRHNPEQDKLGPTVVEPPSVVRVGASRVIAVRIEAPQSDWRGLLVELELVPLC
jgi:hypothetical protein